jgi:hypothetical protein
MRSLQRASIASLVLGLAIPVAAQAPKRAPLTYGTTAVSYVEIPAEAFLPGDSTTGYAAGSYARYSTTCDGFCLGAPLHLPSGAKVVYLELDFDDEDSNYSMGRLVQCDSVGTGCTNHPAAGPGPRTASPPA